MIDTLFWSLIAVTWLTVGMHVVKEFIRFNRKKDDKTQYEKTEFFQKACYETRKWMEKGDGCKI